MNWLAKINLPIVVERLGPFKSALMLFGVIGLCLFVGYRLGNYFHGYQIQTINQQKQRLDMLYDEQNELVKQINTLSVELDMERYANLKAQRTIKAMEQEHFAVKKELAFYQKVMAPEMEANGLVVDEVVVNKTQSDDHFEFEVVLVQQKIRKRYAKGYIELRVAGSIDGKPKTLALSKISPLKRADLSFSFQYFQRIKGAFTLPEKFIPEKVHMNVILPKGKWQKYQKLTHSITWPEDK